MERFNTYSEYCKRTFGTRVLKLAVDAGFSCPNRDAATRQGGCTFCNNDAFHPAYGKSSSSISEQLSEALEFHLHRRPTEDVARIAYFQTFSNTYGTLERLKRCCNEALRYPGIRGIIIATRPDCVDEEKLDYLASLPSYVAVEYGIESCYDSTLLRVNRGHGFADTRKAVCATAERHIHCGGHLMFGLPGETREMMLKEVEVMNALPLTMLKFHQLQILKGTALGSSWDVAMGVGISPKQKQEQFGVPFRVNEYVTLVCDFLERLRPDIVIERLASEVPPRFQAAPQRGWKKTDGNTLRVEELTVMVATELARRGTRQGSLYEKKGCLTNCKAKLLS